MPHGPYDHRPTPSGKVVLEYLNGGIPGYVDTAMNVAHVDDLAAGHLLALEKGQQGRSYICGGENITMSRLLAILSEVTGLASAQRKFPSFFPLVAGYASQVIEGTTMTFDDARARTELGYRSRKAALALYESARWFVEHGYVIPERVAQIHWNPPTPS
jgi:dihydroflavonol-4-reductase